MEIYFVLVEPAVPENVGAVARAIKTMSFNKLRLVNPCNYLSIEAKKLAHASVEILDMAEVFPTLDKAVEDIDFIIGTSAKNRRVKHDYYPAERLTDIIRKKGSAIRSAGIVFGREEYGLSNEEISRCDILSTIPMAGKYPSLNLSHAVMIVAYELSALHLESPENKTNTPEASVYKAAGRVVKDVLVSIGADRNEVLCNRIMERISMAGEDDLHLLYSVCKLYRESKR